MLILISEVLLCFISELSVNISVSYTPPPGFIPGPNEYRAASGPVTVTCTAIGGTEDVSYQWSSNCTDCPFSTSKEGEITRRAVHSGDTGTHTCTATAAGMVESANIDFIVKGKHKQLWNNLIAHCNYVYRYKYVFKRNTNKKVYVFLRISIGCFSFKKLFH